MNTIRDSYQANKKYILAFLILAAFMFLIYTQRLLDIHKIGVAVVFIVAISLL